MSDFSRKGSIVFGLILFAIGVAWVWSPYAANWGALAIMWFGIGALGYSVSKYSK
jgi:fucose permease